MKKKEYSAYLSSLYRHYVDVYESEGNEAFQALVQNKASRVKTHSSNEKYTFRTWLLRLGLIGDEFKTARHHLLKNLDGCIAWKDPQQAVMQRERLQSAQETNNEALEDVQEEIGMHMQQM